MKNYDIKIWDGTRLGPEVCVDTETTLAPFHTRDHDLVTCQAYSGGDSVYFIKRDHIRRFFNVHRNSKLIFQNAPFDIGVLSKITGREYFYHWYDNDQIYDTKILFQLYTLAVRGQVEYKSSLKRLSKILLNREIDKDESVRCNFEQFMEYSIGDIPEKFLKYAAEDAIHTYDVYCKLLALIAPHDKLNTLLSHHIQVKGDLALDAIYKNGVGFNLEGKRKWLDIAEAKMYSLEKRMAVWGYVPGRKGNTRMFESALTMMGLDKKLPKTATGAISSSSKDLEKFSDIQFISDYLEYNGLKKASDFVQIEDKVVHPRYTTIKNTGRTSCAGPNVQQLPRVGGIRELFVPKSKDNVFVGIDYSALELATLSQCLLNLYGHSKMADLINADKDLHYATATSIYKKNEDEISKDERQFSKIPNFAFPTNMAPITFVDYCRPMGIKITEEEAGQVKKAWLSQYPEMNQFFSEPNYHKEGMRRYGRDMYTHYSFSGRKRANATYTAFLNSYFQGMAADGAKLALYEATKQGLEVVAFIHDELVFECKREDAGEVLEKGAKIMINSMKKIVKDVKISVEGGVKDSLTKEAKEERSFSSDY